MTKEQIQHIEDWFCIYRRVMRDKLEPHINRSHALPVIDYQQRLQYNLENILRNVTSSTEFFGIPPVPIGTAFRFAVAVERRYAKVTIDLYLRQEFSPDRLLVGTQWSFPIPPRRKNLRSNESQINWMKEGF
jgi:hypothetical protein